MPFYTLFGYSGKKKGNSMNKAAKKRGCGSLFLITFCILLSVLCAAAYVFREEIYLIYTVLTTSEDAVESQKVENDKKTHELLDKVSDITMRDLTDEERKMLQEGLLTYEDAMKLIMGETLAPVTSAPASEDTDVPEETTTATQSVVPAIVTEETDTVTKPAETTAVTTAVTTVVTTSATTSIGIEIDPEKIVALKQRQNEIIAEIYLLRATYLNKIDELIVTSREEYIALPKDKHNLSGKLEFAEKVIIPRGYALEDECDSKMEVLLDELRGILESLGTDASLVGEINSAYKEQKRLKKTELINEYMPTK